MSADQKLSKVTEAGVGAAFSAPYAPPDEALAAALMAQASRAPPAERRIDAYATRLIEGIRAKRGALVNA